VFQKVLQYWRKFAPYQLNNGQGFTTVAISSFFLWKGVEMARRRGNHEGSIYQLPSGTYRAQITLQGHRLAFTAKTRRECQEWIRRTRDRIDDGMTYANTRLKLGDYLSDWLAMEKSVFRSTTWAHYNQLIRMYIVPYIGGITLVDVRTLDIQGLYNHLIELQVGIPTIRKTHKLLRSALGTAVEVGMIGRNPVSYAHPPREPELEIRILDETQISQFLASISGHKWEALFFLAITTGMRRGELLALRWENMDWIKRTIRIEQQLSHTSNAGTIFQPLKTKSSRRTIALGEKTILVLRAHYESQRIQRLAKGSKWIDYGLIFTNAKGGPICASYLIRVFQRLLEASGLPKVRFHSIRHSAATVMLRNGVQISVVSRRLGHSKISTTLDVYSHILDGMQSEAADKMDELVTPIKLHTNYTRMHHTTQNAIENDDIPICSSENKTNIV
jgi:integrase